MDQVPLIEGDDELRSTALADEIEDMFAPEDLQRTLALIKPDAVAKGAGIAEEIMAIIKHEGFTIVAKKRMQVRERLLARRGNPILGIFLLPFSPNSGIIVGVSGYIYKILRKL